MRTTLRMVVAGRRVGDPPVKIKYFVETKDLDEHTQIDLDRAGNVCAITIEHTKERGEIGA